MTSINLNFDPSDSSACHVERGSVENLSRWQPSADSSLAARTTTRVGGPAKKLVVARSSEEIVDAVKAADEAGEPLLVLSGGSNMLVSDEGFDGTVVQVASRGVTFDQSDCGGAMVRVAAGEVWDNFVEFTITQGWVGLEALSGIPGLVGATPIQNVGAYGQEVATTIARVRTWDRQAGEQRTFTFDQCGFGYRDSMFKRSLAEMGEGAVTGRYVVLEVWFQFELGSMSTPIAYKQLAEALGVEIGQRADAREVREAVLKLRASKGMVLDEADHDTWSTGSFFTNPILCAKDAAKLPDEAPKFEQADGSVKSSAAWLIDHAGFKRGYPGEGAATLSTKHVLALTNRGGASATELVELATKVRDGVEETYGVKLVPEPVLVGLKLG
ncbi:UDP-N-acetylenolpyruvoylglucosamine reductase [Propionimicrobium lymphophilum ACS-093-V-SCH5]|uniref:UDP-N-acetylenolpyruvoylglucosamine reductase n=1 Tax=Propionimicrobium lymphophilum ACS-093-V-SCH5 TaxID=883161 RepID=S2X148_9ACTN|nr:UDP-N-acetylenolpyruvoylglucosamine reductase [Propionimicrobium lymphophilum ACS-093-V-SCH5]